MVISHYGLGMVKVALGDTVIVFNPINEHKEWKPVRFGADVALVSLNDSGYNGVGNVSRGERVPFMVYGPGEYEIGGIFIKGWATKGPGGKINTVYSLVLDNTKLVHLGALAEAELGPEITETMGAVDILFVPVGPSIGFGAGNGQTINAKQAAALSADLEPRLVVPVNFETDDALKTFLKEMGAEGGKTPVESLSVKRKDLAEKEGEVAVIKSW